MRILITGAAGFIGHALVKALAKQGNELTGIDNLSPLSNERIKQARLNDLGISVSDAAYGKVVKSNTIPSFRFLKLDVADRDELPRLFTKEQYDCVVHLAAQAGVRRSMDAPFAYAETNLIGFINILECCRKAPSARLIFASSSSVYGAQSQIPFAETASTDAPLSFYAATKKADELFAYSYHKLFGISAVALRFFTVYGPWGRPDMAPLIFLKAITQGTPLRLFNRGRMTRDFTYVDDVVECIRRVVIRVSSSQVFSVYNIGSASPVSLNDFLATLEQATGKKAIVQLADMQPGDVPSTMADVSRFVRDYGYRPRTPLTEGLASLYRWYKNHSNNIF